MSAVVVSLVMLGVGLVAVSPAPAAGQASGQSSRCNKLTNGEFDRIGERVMGRMLGSPQTHESMDRLMERMMGPANERRMHVVMGERFSGCGNPALPGGYAGMMGAMGMMGGLGPGRQGSPGFGGAYGPGSMMGFDRSRADGDGGNVSVGWMIAMMLVLVLGAAAAVYFIGRTTRRRQDPSQLLAQRFARGEIDAEEYRRRNDLLGGTG